MIRDKQITYEHPSILKKRRNVPLTFTRASVGYDKYGNSVPINQPRFGMFNGPDEGILIEEAHTNLLTADVSQALTTESPYTTGTLDGTYTFSCRTGSYELSGGTTGTVTPTSPQTKTITSATVTLTGTATYNQITKTGYLLSWTLGGSTMAAESLTAPSSVLDLTQGTIEMEFVESPGFKNAVNHYLFEHQNSLKNRCCIVRLASGSLTNRMSNNAEQSSNSGNILDTLDLWSNNTVSMSWDSTILNLFLNGVNSGFPGANPYLPEVKQTIYLGGYSNRCNTLIRNITISKTKRTDPDIANRSGRDGFGVDRQVTLIAPLKNNLNAYRVATV